MNGLFDPLKNKFSSSIAELIPKAVKESITSRLYDDINDTCHLMLTLVQGARTLCECQTHVKKGVLKTLGFKVKDLV